MFIDNDWFKADTLFNNFELILSSAIHTLPVPVGEALLSFLGMIHTVYVITYIYIMIT